MRIAFLSHEFPPDTGGGGIGTYLDQIATALRRDGHEVAVFCGAASAASSTVRPDGTEVHRLAADSAVAFREALVPAFAAAHAQRPFDVIEGNDFDAPALAVKRALPSVPLVVKLHTPRFAIDELHFQRPSAWQRTRMALGALRRGRWPAAPVPIRAEPAALAELDGLALADEIAAPSRAIAEAAAAWVPTAATRISVFPYPYRPAPALLELPPPGTQRRVTFLGRLEARKGVIDLADAIPVVRAAHPDVTFRFIGRAMSSPESGADMTEFLRRRLGRHRDAVEFVGVVPPDSLPRWLGETDVLVAPSHWESFGLVCCEGLAAGRAVVGSNSGGMVEILDEGRCGRLVSPRNPAALARTISDLLHEPAEQRRLGAAGRERILAHYAFPVVLQAQLASYARAIARARVA